MDMFADNILKMAIIKIIENGGEFPSDDLMWFNDTKKMLKKYPAFEIFSRVEKAVEEASDEQWFEHKYPKGFFKETWIFPKKKRSVVKINLKQSRLKKLINDNIKITDVAKGYGLKLKGKGNLAICPFHNDTQRSLGFSDEKNVFHCFGCNAKGDIITFKRRMKKWEKGMKPQKNF